MHHPMIFFFFLPLTKLNRLVKNELSCVLKVITLKVISENVFELNKLSQPNKLQYLILVVEFGEVGSNFR